MCPRDLECLHVYQANAFLPSVGSQAHIRAAPRGPKTHQSGFSIPRALKQGRCPELPSHFCCWLGSRFPVTSPEIVSSAHSSSVINNSMGE